MEAITRLVTDSLARHGFDHPVDPRRLQWSRWFRCDSPHSLLVVPSKPGIFALAEEIMGNVARAPSPAMSAVSEISAPTGILGGAALQCCDSLPALSAASAPEVRQRRMLAVLQFSEDDDMAFTLDRMFTRPNPMRARLSSGRCFLRFVVIEDQAQRRSICAALNQWMLNSAEKATGIPSDFSSSLELPRVGAGDSPAHVGDARVGTDAFVRSPSEASIPRVGRTLPSDSAGIISKSAQTPPPKQEATSAALDSGANKNLHCPHPLPSGF